MIETHLAANKGTSTLHWNGYKKGEHRSVGKTWDGPGLHEGFHTYGVEWTPQFIRVYYDGRPVWTHEGKGVPKVEEYIRCSVGILDWVDGDIRKARLPQYTLFDWVRVYSRRPRE